MYDTLPGHEVNEATKNVNVATGRPTFILKGKLLNGGFITGNCAFIRTTVKNIWCRLSTSGSWQSVSREISSS